MTKTPTQNVANGLEKRRSDMLRIASSLTGGIAGVVMLASAVHAQAPSDPKLAASWAFMQEQMPGTPASLLEAACKEGALMVYYGTWVDAEEAKIKRFQER